MLICSASCRGWSPLAMLSRTQVQRTLEKAPFEKIWPSVGPLVKKNAHLKECILVLHIYLRLQVPVAPGHPVQAGQGTINNLLLLIIFPIWRFMLKETSKFPPSNPILFSSQNHSKGSQLGTFATHWSRGC